MTISEQFHVKFYKSLIISLSREDFINEVEKLKKPGMTPPPEIPQTIADPLALYKSIIEWGCPSGKPVAYRIFNPAYKDFLDSI